MLAIVMALGQYPILGSRIRMLMRNELFERDITNPQLFEAEVREKAILSQEREGVYNPFVEEPAEVWDLRVVHVRDHLTDQYFSRHLTLDVFEQLVRDVLRERGLTPQELILSENPELAPLDLLFEQASAIETLAPEKRVPLEPRLRESKVVLIRTMISDQLGYINIAKQWFTVADLAEIRRRRIGPGRIGGKAAGMLLAHRVIEEVASEPLRRRVHIPESYFLGTDLLYTFMALNNLTHWNDQKYKPEDQMRDEYPQIQREFTAGVFPPDVLAKFRALLENVGKKPLIVRSSSLLEDNFGASFAGKYESIFCPNQGTPEQNLNDLERAIAWVYATTLNPSALVYRRSKGLQDYDERMGILIQVVEGEPWGRYFLPHLAGVAFSRNLYRWSPQIRQQDGFIRLVWGLGTRAVDCVGNDYPRLVALSHPLLRPSSAPHMIRRYSQQYVDLIDLKDNQMKSIPVREAMGPSYELLRFLAQLDQDDFFSSLHSRPTEKEIPNLILTFEELLRRTPFADTMREILQILEENYHSPVDMEFTARLTNLDAARPDVEITIVQCRPQSLLQEIDQVRLPVNLPPEKIIFSTRLMVPQGHVLGIRYIIFVPPEAYFSIPSEELRLELRRIIGQLNQKLEGQVFVCVGPGRWGSTNYDLGVPVAYGDIYNARSLIELTGFGSGPAPEPSYGTHFFQDLVEAQIYPLAVSLDDPETVFRRDLFYDTPNRLDQFVQAPESLRDCLRLIDVEDYRPGQRIDLVMENSQNQALAYLVAAR